MPDLLENEEQISTLKQNHVWKKMSLNLNNLYDKTKTDTTKYNTGSQGIIRSTK